MHSQSHNICIHISFINAFQMQRREQCNQTGYRGCTFIVQKTQNSKLAINYNKYTELNTDIVKVRSVLFISCS